MGKIHILPENLANKIAAGEVVQRPESVVKELLENSIDANATAIDLLIKRAGKALIQVIDNGDGMTEEDAILSIQKHATSKISSLEDLDAIKTLGFRGEALSSISAVSQLEIQTETRTEELGIAIRVEDNGKLNIEKGSFPKGTAITIKNLFYNVPARRNFLKSDSTELKHVVDTFNKIALSHPEKSFRFFIDEEVTLDYPAGTIDDRVTQVFGEQTFRSLVKVSESLDIISVSGFIGKPSLLKKQKGEQYLFINNRFVQSKQINHAVFTAYENILEKGDYPFFILFVELDPAKIDINVHPTKLEVRFENERDIYAFVLSAVKRGLSSYDLVPQVSFNDGSGFLDSRTTFQPANRVERNDFGDRPGFVKRPMPSTRLSDSEIDAVFSSLNTNVDRERSMAPARAPFDPPAPEALPFTEERPTQPQIVRPLLPDEREEMPFLVQLHNKYILTPIRSGLMIIDQHVAHERILYEKALNMMETSLYLSQQLLFPKTFQVNPGVYMTLREISDLLVKLGFEISLQSKNTVSIMGVPQDFENLDEETALVGMVEEYIQNQRVKKITDARDNIAKSYSCKSAIKAGDPLNETQMRQLIDKLFATSMPYVCPHGRPVVIKIAVDEFDRRFGRTS
jgi:DNA mismatch repair protein MutL